MDEKVIEEKNGLPSFEELKKVDVTKYLKKRDGIDYLNWADCKQLLHENGAKVVYFIPLTNENGSSLFMSDQIFTDTKGNTNRCYETRIKVIIDDKTYEMQSPVMNGANPVKDNSMSQQRVWNSMTRSFVKAVAIYTGLGFDLWAKTENNDDDSAEEDLSVHNIFKIKERCQVIYTNLIKTGMSTKDIAIALHKTEDEVKALFTYFDILSNFEKDMLNIDIKQR